MRIVDRKTFLAMPKGTVYAKYATLGSIGEICIKGESGPDDWWYVDLSNAVDSNDSNEFFERMLAAEKGAPFRQDYDCYSRDGLFDHDQLFAIWEPDDVRALIAALQGALDAQGTVTTT